MFCANMRSNGGKMGLKLSVVAFVVLSSVLIYGVSVQGADRLVIKNSGGTSTFTIQDTGTVQTSDRYRAQSEAPGFFLDETGAGNKGAYLVLDGKRIQVQRRAQGFGAWEAGILEIYVAAPQNSFILKENGYLGLGVANPAHPIHAATANGAHLTAGGTWTNASSREFKQNIKELTTDEAVDTLKALKAVTFEYKNDPGESCVGFIAEDVPDLVATQDRKGMSPMDVVAVLTRVVQEQQKLMEQQGKTIAELSGKLEAMDRTR